MKKYSVWHTSNRGIRGLIPRNERGYVVLPVSFDTAEQVKLHIEGLVARASLNGRTLKRNGSSFTVPDNCLKPWENEIFLYGWPKAAWLEAGGEKPHPFDGRSYSLSDTDVLSPAANALCAFIVKGGPDTGDIFSFYDPVDQTFRMPRWRWDTGICLEALSRLALIRKDDFLKNCVKEIVNRILTVQLDDPNCPGGFPEVADPHMAPKNTPTLPEWVVPFNGAFIGVGLLAASEVLNGDVGAKCVRAAKQANALMLSHAITANGFLKGYYHVDEHQWQYHGQINDSAIYPRLAWRLSERGIPVNLDAVSAYANAIRSLVQPEGYVGRACFRPDEPVWPAGRPLFPEWKKHPHQIPAKIFVRGQAWAILGLNGAWCMTRDNQVARDIRRIIDYLIHRQDQSGLWHHDLRQPRFGLDVKGTASIGWAMLEAMPVYEAAGGDVYRLIDAIHRAWGALKKNQKKYFTGPIPGALCDEGEEGAIIYYRNRPMYTAYATAAFILFGLGLEDMA